MQVSGVELEDNATLLTSYMSEEVLADMLATEEKRAKSAKQKNKIVSKRSSVCDTALKVGVSTLSVTCMQVGFQNVSTSYLMRQGTLGGKDMQASARMQITPFTRSGWIIGHPMRCVASALAGSSHT